MIGFLSGLPGVGFVSAAARIFIRPVAAAWRWFTADFTRVIIAALLIVILAHWLVLDPAVRADRDAARTAFAKSKKALTTEQAAHASTVAQYRQAAVTAQAVQAANIARVAAEQDAQTQRISQGYENDLDVLRARRDHLAQQLRETATGVAGLSAAVRVPSASEGPGSASSAPSGEGLPSARCTPMNLDERFIASAQAIQLDALIDWVVAQSVVEMNP